MTETFDFTLLAAATPPDQIQWKPQGKPFKKEEGYLCRAVPHFDARYTQNRLDAVVGPINWQVDAKEVHGIVLVGIAIREFLAGGWVWKWDTGMEADPFEDIKKAEAKERDDRAAIKGVISGGLKRAGVLWGIGRDVYAMDQKWLACEVDERGKFIKWAKKTAKADAQAKALKPKTDVADARKTIVKYLSGNLEWTADAAEKWLAQEEKKHGVDIDALRKIYRIAEGTDKGKRGNKSGS